MYYHSNEGLAIVGIAKVGKEAFQDPSTDNEAWVAVELKPFKKLKTPVTLDTIKKDKRLSNMALVRISQLSVQPVSDEEYKVIKELAPIVGGKGGGKPDMAEGGGNLPEKLSEALEASYRVVEQLLS